MLQEVQNVIFIMLKDDLFKYDITDLIFFFSFSFQLDKHNTFKFKR